MAPAGFAQRVARQRRLDILRLLSQAPRYETSQMVLYQALPDVGPAATDEQVGSDLRLLAEVDLVTIEEIGHTLMARITQRGIDVAEGRATAPCVARPRPGS